MKTALPKSLMNDWLDSSKRPTLAMIVFVHVVTLWLQGPEVVTKETYSGFTIVLIMFAAIYVHKDRLFKRRKWLYFVIQGTIVFDCAVIMGSGFETVYIALLPLLVYESLFTYGKMSYVFLTAIPYYGIFSGLIIYIDGLEALKAYLPILGFVTFAVGTFNVMYQNQVELRIRSQALARELEIANSRIEAMTLERERERVARDLHDTLSQGLSALVLQMETMKVYLDMEKTEKAQSILEQSTKHARRVLEESRQVLNELRVEGSAQQDVRIALTTEVQRFNEFFNGDISTEMKEPIYLDLETIRQMNFICREILTNIDRHAKAKHVTIVLHANDEVMQLRVTDDGVGFNTRFSWREIGHFGLQGMSERVKAIGGEMDVFSRKRMGTTVDISIPIKKGELL
ncbi:sensor histidine kinase [Fusibacter paucivorans]|uniref:histidine kinase n=1 Tax=Fusibacter paucivorans TaxID=76009 RepID=A0ABS5PU33_9FIRM|nr:sensor histidine kinase [Fusibacter paucivorans]MBS7527871.1 sensor histidine kinase [Fusibacter paucivorans]